MSGTSPVAVARASGVSAPDEGTVAVAVVVETLDVTDGGEVDGIADVAVVDFDPHPTARAPTAARIARVTATLRSFIAASCVKRSEDVLSAARGPCHVHVPFRLGLQDPGVTASRSVAARDGEVALRRSPRR